MEMPNSPSFLPPRQTEKSLDPSKKESTTPQNPNLSPALGEFAQPIIIAPKQKDKDDANLVSTVMHLSSNVIPLDAAVIGKEKCVLPSSSSLQDASSEYAAFVLIELTKAFEEGDTERVDELLKGIDYSIQDRNGNTAFHIICEHGTAEMVKRVLVDTGPDILHDQPNNRGQPPLHMALRNTHPEQIAEILIQAGANIDTVDHQNRSALYIACMQGNLSFIKCLLKYGASSNSKARSSESLLHIAGKYNHPDVIKYLVAEGADIDATTSRRITPLMTACIAGSADAVEQILKAGANIGVASRQDLTPMHLACEHDNVAIIQHLIKAGADLNAEDREGKTPLVVACQRGNIKQVEFLLQLHADTRGLLNACDSTNQEMVSLILKSFKDRAVKDAALWEACKEGEVKALRLLLQHGASVAIQDDDLNTPLHLAAHSGNPETTALLLENGAQSYAQNLNSQTPLSICMISPNRQPLLLQFIKAGATLNIHPQEAENLVRLAMHNRDEQAVIALLPLLPNLNISDAMGTPLLHQAYELQLINVVHELIRLGADVDQTNSNGNALLHLTMQSGSDALILELIKCGASGELWNTHGMTPFDLACYFNRKAVIHQFIGQDIGYLSASNVTSPLIHASARGNMELFLWSLKQGIGINSATQTGFTPLQIACKFGQFEIARLLLEKGADINANSKGTPSPLMLAAINGNRDLLLWLLDKGVDVNCTDAVGTTPLHHVCQKGLFDVARQLIDRGASINVNSPHIPPPAISAAKRNDRDFLLWLLDRGVDVNTADAAGNTLLQYASDHGLFDVAERLTDNGADIYAGGDGVPSPLISAASKGNIDFLKRLLDKGVNVNITDKNNNTPLLRACVHFQLDVANELINRGADVNVKNALGYSPLMAAMFSGNQMLVSKLIEKGAEIYASTSEGPTSYGLVLSNPQLVSDDLTQKLSKQDMGRTVEILSRKLLAHRFGIAGTTLMDQSINLEGWSNQPAKSHLQLATEAYYNRVTRTFDKKEGTWSEILKGVSPSTRRAADALDRLQVQQVLDETFEAIKESLCNDPDELMARLETGKPVGLLLSIAGHTVALALYQSRCARCNKGDFSGNQPGLRICTIEIPQAIPKGLANCTSKTLTADYFTTGIQKDLGLTNEYYIAQKQQKVGNCSVANSNGMEAALLFLQLEPLIGSDAAKELSTAIKKGRVADSRVGSLKTYLDAHSKQSIVWPADLSLLSKIYHKQTGSTQEDRECKAAITRWIQDQGIALSDFLLYGPVR